MFALIVTIAGFAYSIFLLGILNILTPLNIYSVTGIFIITVIILTRKYLKFNLLKLDLFSKLLLLILIIKSLVNFIGVLGPEIGFDALWYHLTLPKLWIQHQSLVYLPGPIFKYSVMPMLTEMLYLPAILIQGANLAKFIHLSFGLLACIVTYKISRIYISKTWSLLAVIIFYSNLVVGWESTSAYIDLSRTFFEASALYFVLKNQYLKGSVSLGLAISVKLISAITLPVFLLLLFMQKKSAEIPRFILLSFLIPAPWFIRSFLTTGNPIYPFFSSMLGNIPISLNPADLWILFTKSPDPVSPLYLILIPFVFFIFRRTRSRGLVLYCGLSLIFWFITPRSGGGRFILPYLPAFSVLSVLTIYQIKDRVIKYTLIIIAVSLSLFSICYRFSANSKFLPVITGLQSTGQFLSDKLIFSVGDYVDSDNFLKNNLPADAKLSVLGINNLFYINYFISDISPNYILIRYTDAILPPKYSKAILIHENLLTKTRLYKL